MLWALPRRPRRLASCPTVPGATSTADGITCKLGLVPQSPEFGHSSAASRGAPSCRPTVGRPSLFVASSPSLRTPRGQVARPKRRCCRREPDRGPGLDPVGGHRERAAGRAEAAALIAALPDVEQPPWATALYSGLRLGELRALRRKGVDLGAGEIRSMSGVVVAQPDAPTGLAAGAGDLVQPQATLGRETGERGRGRCRAP
jgi:hypothetical protein